ncbi:MAG: hypothetical protein JRI25_20700 [Deltaproteobacteria bacterium]|nr:hypothetical protein [Deltaproteobacteria bacterium]
MDTLDISGEYSAPTEPLSPDGDSTTLSRVPPDMRRAPRWWPRWLTFLFVGLVVLLFAVSAVAGWITFRSYQGQDDVEAEVPATRPTPTPLVLPPHTPTTTPAPPSDPNIAYMSADLWLSSDPESAEVWEGDKLWGTTPRVVSLGLRPEEPPRTFELRAPGYKPFTVSQGPSPRDVEVHATLSRIQAITVTPAVPEPEPKPDIRIER